MPTRSTRSHQTAISILLMALGTYGGQFDLAAFGQDATPSAPVVAPTACADASAAVPIDPNADQMQKLSFAEKLYFGRVNDGPTNDDRLTHLEQSLFGRSRSGSFEKRFARVDDALGIENRMRQEKLAAAAVAPEASKASESASNVNKPTLPDLSVQSSQPVSTAAADESANTKTADKSVETKTADKSADTTTFSKTADAKTFSKIADAVPQLAKPMEPKLARTPVEKTTGKTATKPNGANIPAGADNDAVHALLKQGMAAHLAGNNLLAQDRFKRALALAPRNADAFYNLGAIAETQGDLIGALTHYRAALGINPLDRQLQEAVRSVEEQVAGPQHNAGNGTTSGAPARITTSNSSHAPTNSAPANHNSASTARNIVAPKSRTASATAPVAAPASGSTPAYTPGYTPATTADVSQQQQPDTYDVSQSDPPVLNASQYPSPSPANPKAFNLQTSQYGANLVNQPPTYGVYQQPPPIYGVSQTPPPLYNVSQNPPPVAPVSHGKPPTHGLLGAFMSVGGGAALGPLHCPICRLSQMGW